MNDVRESAGCVFIIFGLVRKGEVYYVSEHKSLLHSYFLNKQTHLLDSSQLHDVYNLG